MVRDDFGLYEYVEEISEMTMIRNLAMEKEQGYEPESGDEDDPSECESDPRIYFQIYDFSKEQEARIKKIGKIVGAQYGMEGLQQIHYALHYQK